MQSKRERRDGRSLRERLYIVIFETETPAGRAFDVALLAVIVASVATATLESVREISANRRELFAALEWGFSTLFLAEYLLRLYCAREPLRYAGSFFGIVDLTAALPAIIGFFIPTRFPFVTVRLLRLMRLFRILKLTGMLDQATVIVSALRASRRKISVFLFAVSIVTIVFGAVMYSVEGAVNPGFDSIPRSVYWCIVTMTTVGYGDISPSTPLGQFLAALLMLIGYSIIAIPTGIVTSELVRGNRGDTDLRDCVACGLAGHGRDAVFCRRCGERLPPVG